MGSYVKLSLERNKDKTGAEMQDLKPMKTKKASFQNQGDPRAGQLVGWGVATGAPKGRCCPKLEVTGL